MEPPGREEGPKERGGATWEGGAQGDGRSRLLPAAGPRPPARTVVLCPVCSDAHPPPGKASPVPRCPRCSCRSRNEEVTHPRKGSRPCEVAPRKTSAPDAGRQDARAARSSRPPHAVPCPHAGRPSVTRTLPPPAPSHAQGHRTRSQTIPAPLPRVPSGHSRSPDARPAAADPTLVRHTHRPAGAAAVSSGPRTLTSG